MASGRDFVRWNQKKKIHKLMIISVMRNIHGNGDGFGVSTVHYGLSLPVFTFLQASSPEFASANKRHKGISEK